MSLRLARLDLTQILCTVDDFYREFERLCERAISRLPCDNSLCDTASYRQPLLCRLTAAHKATRAIAYFPGKAPLMAADVGQGPLLSERVDLNDASARVQLRF